MRRLLILAIVVSAAACSDPRPAPTTAQLRLECCGPELADGQLSRVRVDKLRNRLWRLTDDHIDIYGLGSKDRMRRIPRPGSMVGEIVCQPDLVLDRSGRAFLSDNMQPRVWEIDPETFAVTEHAIKLVGGEHLDIGFGQLAIVGGGTLIGVAATGGARWAIDLGSASARLAAPDLSVADDCVLAIPPLAQ